MSTLGRLLILSTVMALAVTARASSVKSLTPSVASFYAFHHDNDVRISDDDDQDHLSQVPEPGALLLVGSGLMLGAGLIRRKLAKN